MLKIDTMIIPAAGFGTRMRTLTGGGSKELIEIGGKPALVYALQEALASGLSRVGIIIREGKEDIVDAVENDPRLTFYNQQMYIEFFSQEKHTGEAGAITTASSWLDEVLKQHPDRAKLALLAAAAHLQCNDPTTARQFIRLAQDWGCSKKLISPILIAGVHNTLGRVAAVAGQQVPALNHFESAIAIGMPGSEIRLLTQARMAQQIEQLKPSIVPVSAAQEMQSPVPISPEQSKSVIKQSGKTNVSFRAEAYAYYQTISKDPADKTMPPYIQFDTKSLQRSGLHDIKRIFSRVLEDHFSFCERYQEPGCCKTMPCALTGYAQRGKKTQTARLRLTKSHDFALDDPVFLPYFSLRRIILVRPPLFLITSWFALDQLQKHRQFLQQSHINMPKIWASHEPEVLMMAYQELDNAFIAPNSDSLSTWLDEKTEYILNFLHKWVKPAIKNPQFLQILRYDEINLFNLDTLKELYDYLPDEAQKCIKTFHSSGTSQFRPRQNPFLAFPQKLTSYMYENSKLFTIAAINIVSSAPKGTFGNNYII